VTASIETTTSSWPRRLLALVGLASAVVGCGTGLNQTGTEGAVEEHMPAYAGLWLAADPTVAAQRITVSLQDPDNPGWSEDASFERGTIVRTSFGVSAGTYRIVAADPGCALDLTLGPERESDLVIHVPGDGTCSFEVVREHGADVSHVAAGSLDARVTAAGDGLLVELRSLDTPKNPVPDPVPPDEGRLAIVEPVWPGRYEVRLVRGDEVLETQRIVVDETASGDLVELVLDGRPD
jgi:hypothetical protein